MRPDEIAMRWLGTPFRLHGRGPGGVDCVGLVVVVARELGLDFDDFLGYGRHAADHALLRHLECVAEREPLDASGPGSLVVLAERRFPGHCGFRAGDDRVVHASTARRAVAVDRLGDLGALVASYRMKGA